jgi:hypothetical protein
MVLFMSMPLITSLSSYESTFYQKNMQVIYKPTCEERNKEATHAREPRKKKHMLEKGYP